MKKLYEKPEQTVTGKSMQHFEFAHFTYQEQQKQQQKIIKTQALM